MAQRVLVTGGAGFIGSHIVDAYVAAGLDVAVVDNLSDRLPCEREPGRAPPRGGHPRPSSAGQRLRRGAPGDRQPPGGPGERPRLDGGPGPRCRDQRDRLAQRPGGVPPGGGPQADLRSYRRRGRGRADVPAGGRGPPGRPAQPVRCDQARRRALLRALPAELGPGDDDPPLRQHLRAAPGPDAARPASSRSSRGGCWPASRPR